MLESEIKMVMKDNDYQEMKARIDYYEYKEVLKYFFKLAKEKFHVIDGITLAVVHWDWVKWDAYYSKYATFIYEYLEELREQGKPFKFVRVDENINIEILDSYGEKNEFCCDIINPRIHYEIDEDI